MRHQAGIQAFRKRRRETNRGIYVEPPNTSPISPGGRLPEKGTADWLRIRGDRWKEEVKRIVEAFKWWKKCQSEMLFEREAARERLCRHLEIPYIRYPSRDEPYESIKDMPENQEAIREMLEVNPVLHEEEWIQRVQDWQDPEGAEHRREERRLRREEEQRRIVELQEQAAQQRQRELQAQALVQNQRPVFVEQNLGHWVRKIEEDERLRMETPTEGRTRERREQIQENRRYLERDGRFTGIIEGVHRLPDGPERREVFRRFWANLYTQEYQNPLAREDADLLSLRTAAIRELEALEDEERRETGGRELVRPIALLYEDGSLVEGWDRSSPATGASVSALE
jgi:hypothetical protein